MKDQLLDYAALLLLMLLTTGLFFLGNVQPDLLSNLLYARTEGVIWASSHFSSTLAVVSAGWLLVAFDRFKRPFWPVLAMFDMGSLHEILFSRLYYINSLPAFAGTWSSLTVSMVALAITFVWGKDWMKVGCAVVGVFLPVYFFAVGQYQPPTVLLNGGFNMPWAAMPAPNLLDISSWAIPSALFVMVRRFA